MEEQKKHYLVYKITNNINGKIYIGIHVTNNINDGYMGSGTYLKNSQKKYGRGNFTKEIICDYDSFEEMNNKEIELVNEEFIKRDDNYNMCVGGYDCFAVGRLTAKDKDGKLFNISKNDPRYLSGELVGNSSGTVTVKDENGVVYQVSIDDPRYLSGELVFIRIGAICTEETKKKISNSLRERYKMFDRVLSEETKKKIGDDAKERYKNPKNNPSYGSLWIYNMELKENKKIKKEELSNWINKGWFKGRKIKWKM